MLRALSQAGALVYVEPCAVVAITDFSPEPGAPPIPGVSVIMLQGGGALVVKLTKESAAQALGLLAPANGGKAGGA